MLVVSHMLQLLVYMKKMSSFYLFNYLLKFSCLILSKSTFLSDIDSKVGLGNLHHKRSIILIHVISSNLFEYDGEEDIEGQDAIIEVLLVLTMKSSLVERDKGNIWLIIGEREYKKMNKWLEINFAGFMLLKGFAFEYNL